MLRKARERHAERLAARDPGEWGISAQILELPTSADLRGGRDRRKVVWARRSDAFELLHQAKKYDDDGRLVAGISDLQLRAAQRYVRDWMERMGVGHGVEVRERVDESDEPKFCRADYMVAAGQKLDETHARLGRTSVRVLRAIVEPMMAGEVRPWRALVQAATGESDKTAQATVVRTACEDLRLVHDEIDGVAPRNDAEARVPLRLWRASE